ncbi:MAG: TIGR01244 family sulfur transferase [Geminicoccaceae bacterium]
MSGPFRQVAEDFFVAPQLQADDFAAARAFGIRTVINNRPDGEAPDQLSDETARALAEAAGLAYVHVPVVTGGIGPEAMSAFAEAVDQHGGPFLAYCRSGTRSCFLWALQAARHSPSEPIVAAGAAAGYDLAPLAPLLRKIHAAKD